jgi:hypothetical protein
MPPISAAFTVLMRNASDIATIANAINQSLGDLMAAYPDRLENVIITPSNDGTLHI